MAYWLVKSEPGEYSIEDLEKEGRAVWDGVRNYQARNFLKAMEEGDLVLFYHSNAKPPGVVGLARVVRSGIADPTQFDPASPYHDPRSTPEAPRWITVELRHLETFPRIVSLSELRVRFSPEEFRLLRRGNRLSVLPVPEPVFEAILALARTQGA